MLSRCIRPLLCENISTNSSRFCFLFYLLLENRKAEKEKAIKPSTFGPNLPSPLPFSLSFLSFGLPTTQKLPQTQARKASPPQAHTHPKP